MAESKIANPQTYVNPVLLEDAGRGLAASAGRLLDYERYLDGLEHQMMRDEPLPPAVERSLGSSIQGNVADAETMSRQVLELTGELDAVGAFEALFSSLDERFEQAGAPELIKEASGSLENWLEQRGLPSTTWRWAAGHIRWDGVAARAEDGAIVVSRRDRTIGVISAAPSAEMDAASFVTRAYGLPPSIARTGDRHGPLRLSASESVEMAERALTTFYRWRAQRTALDGIQVCPTGIWWVVIVLVIAVILVVAGASILILCGIGSITNQGLCTIGVLLLVLGFIGLAIGGAGYVESDPPKDSPDYDYDTEPDPFG
jgi:hypothetical protein